PVPALWDWGYLDRCFARHRVCISFSLWLCASSCWIAAHTLLLYLRCAKKCKQDQSALCAACCLLASLCDTVGAILARQLTIQVFTGAYLAAVDLMNFVFILFPVCGSKFKSNSGHGSQERKGRRRLRASVFALTLPLSLGPCWALWAAVPKASGLVQGPQRRLLGSQLQDNTEMFGYLLGGIAACGSWASRIPPLSRIVRLGLGLGLTETIHASVCMVPVRQILRGRRFPKCFCLTSISQVLGRGRVLLRDEPFKEESRESGLALCSNELPNPGTESAGWGPGRRGEGGTGWLQLSASLALNSTSQIIFLSWVMKSKMRRALGFASEARESPDTQALLTCAEKEEDNEEARNQGLENRWSHQCLHVEGTENSDWVPLTTLPHCKPLRTMTAISHYMELTIEPVQQAGCSAARLPGDGQMSTGDVPLQEPPSYPPIRVIRARVSSSSSSEVPSINSDLEHKYWEALSLKQCDPEDKP
ncbi:PREDICTED: transmembrane protein 44, partial [Myotis brandtii]|uniref:transmembrane protein 44 n=1 Tax=Myotis brandtii TaxID=109478 RepID=UPI0007042A7C